MTGVNLAFAEEDREAITERCRELGRFESGDRVTVEPSDNEFAYAGSELEGVLLTVDDVFWSSNCLYWVLHDDHPRSDREQQRRERYDDYEQRVVELQGDYEHTENEAVFIHTVEYVFEEDVPTAHHMSEKSLIPWDEFREEHDRVKLPPKSHNGNTSEWVEEAEENCEICGCNVVLHSVFDNGFHKAGHVECPACGDVKEEHYP